VPRGSAGPARRAGAGSASATASGRAVPVASPVRQWGNLRLPVTRTSGSPLPLASGSEWPGVPFILVTHEKIQARLALVRLGYTAPASGLMRDQAGAFS